MFQCIIQIETGIEIQSLLNAKLLNNPDSYKWMDVKVKLFKSPYTHFKQCQNSRFK